MQIISRLILTDTKRRAMHWSHVLYSMVQIIYQTLPICPNRTCMWFDFGTFVVRCTGDPVGFSTRFGCQSLHTTDAVRRCDVIVALIGSTCTCTCTVMDSSRQSL